MQKKNFTLVVFLDLTKKNQPPYILLIYSVENMMTFDNFWKVATMNE